MQFVVVFFLFPFFFILLQTLDCCCPLVERFLVLMFMKAALELAGLLKHELSY